MPDNCSVAECTFNDNLRTSQRKVWNKLDCYCSYAHLEIPQGASGDKWESTAARTSDKPVGKPQEFQSQVILTGLVLANRESQPKEIHKTCDFS